MGGDLPEKPSKKGTSRTTFADAEDTRHVVAKAQVSLTNVSAGSHDVSDSPSNAPPLALRDVDLGGDGLCVEEVPVGGFQQVWVDLGETFGTRFNV